MNLYLIHLAQRVADAPDFLAYALAEYARSEQLEDAGLSAQLGCPVETLTHLRLCRMPRAQAPLFWQDVEQIAQRFSVSAEVLAEVARRSQSLFHLREAAGAQKDERIGALLQRLASRLGKPKALSALAHKLGRAFYHMLHTKEVFDVNRFVRH